MKKYKMLKELPGFRVNKVVNLNDGLQCGIAFYSIGWLTEYGWIEEVKETLKDEIVKAVNCDISALAVANLVELFKKKMIELVKEEDLMFEIVGDRLIKKIKEM